MTTVAPVTTTKAIRRPRCKHCNKQFRTTSAVKKFCSDQCSKLATKQKRKVSYIDRATDSAFMYLLASECSRAQTLQILEGHTVESLIGLYTIYKYWLRANQYGSVSDYAMSHISPVAGKATVGKFHAHNIVVAPTHMNRSHSNRYYGHGLSVSLASLKDRHRVDKHEPRKTTVARIIHFLGEDVVSEFARVAKLQPTGRHNLLAWLLDHLDVTIPEHAEHLERLHKLSTKALTMLKASLQGKEPTTPYRAPVKEAQALEVFAHELSRHVESRPELKPLATFLLECSQRINPQELFVIDLAFFQALFDLSHGKELADVADALGPVLETLRVMGKVIQAVPVVASPVVAKPPVRVLRRFKSFADEVEADQYGEGLEYIPVIFNVLTATYDEEPLPWDW